jgi:hypothetical protein
VTERRKIDLSVEVVGTPKEVWTAIATGAGVLSAATGGRPHNLRA